MNERSRTVLQRLALLVVAVLVAAGCGSARTVTVTKPLKLQPLAEAKDAGATGCGVERAPVKHLTDGVTLPQTPTVLTVAQLVALTPPAVTPDSPRFTTVAAGSLPETTLVELRDVHVIAAKQEADSDLHVIVVTDTGAEMNLEAPAASCDASSPYAAALAQARAAIDAAAPSVSSQSYTPLDLHATVEGVLFWDVLHGQRGAPNGVELHPVTWFSTALAEPRALVPSGGQPATSTGSSTTVATTGPAATTSTTPTGGRGCARWPGRHWLHHHYHRSCRPNYFTTR